MTTEVVDKLAKDSPLGEVLAAGSVPVTTLRAAMVIGQHSASFQMLRDLVHRLPAMVTPTWVTTRTQPIAFADLRDYLVGVCDLPEAFGRVLDVGGPEILTFTQNGPQRGHKF